MGERLWGIRLPGAPIQRIDDEPGMLILGEPDWIVAPPELGGVRLQVVGIRQARCLFDGEGHHEHLAKHYDLEGTLSVCECCVLSKFGFYHRTQEKAP